MDISDFDYELPKELIAQYPLKNRDECKLLVYDRKSNKIEHRIFKEIIEYLTPDDVLVLNNTKVFNARICGLKKYTNAKIEILLLEKIDDRKWIALIKPAKRVKIDTIIEITEEIYCRVCKNLFEGKFLIEFNKKTDYSEINQIGRVPLPPYIKRERDLNNDKESYQTVYAEKLGAVAAPTAGLHFTENLIRQIKLKGVKIAFVTLHLSYGSFAPLRTKNIENHKIEPEYLIVTEENASIINSRKGRCIAVGTSSVRALEFLANDNKKIIPFNGKIDNYIYPGYKFKIVDAIITNFHLPKTSLFLLVAAFTGTEKLKELYKIAIEKKYRFYSYGDSMFIK